MLEYSPWKIEQAAFEPSEEKKVGEQLAFSNGYISQYAFFEEHYSGEQLVGTFLQGVHRQNDPSPLSLPNPSGISLRLHDERLDLNEWRLEDFYRCLHKGEARLERRFRATSPKGYTVEVEASRMLNQKERHLIEETYTVRFVNYAGVASFIALIGDASSAADWYPLQASVEDDYSYLWVQSSALDLHVCMAERHVLYKNGELQAERPIKIDKSRVLGFAYMHDVCPGDVYSIHKCVAVVDSRDCPKAELPSRALKYLG